MKVLIVDDSKIDLLLCQKIVEALGYSPICVSSAEQALAVLKEPGSPDIIIADWFMPDTTGIELCKTVREMDLLVEPFVLIMTANHDRYAEAEALNAGADDFISKPVNKIDIEAKLKLGRRLIRTQLELLVANQRLSEKLQFDEVTGAMNRQSGLAAISTALSRLSRQEKNQGLLIHCHIRPTITRQTQYRHDFFDKIYFDLANNLALALRQTDVMVRFRDDQFLFFAESDASSHHVLLERIEHAIRKGAEREENEGRELSASIAALAIQPEQASTDISDLLEETENTLARLQTHGIHARIVYLEHTQFGQILSLDEYRKAHAQS